MDFREALLKEMQNQKTKLVESRQKTAEAKVVEDTEEYLEPRFDSRASFYKKAKVVTKDNGDEELYSYGTHVGGVRGGKPYTKGKFSQTTSRHQKDYFMQKGFDPKEVELEEGKKLEEDKYEDELFTRIENALVDADFEVERFTDAGVMTYNLGWVLDGKHQLEVNGSYLEEGKKTEARVVDMETILDIVAKDIIPNLDFIIENGEQAGLAGLVALCEDTKSNLAHGLGELGYYDKKEEVLDISPNVNIDVSDSTIASGNDIDSNLEIPLSLPLPV